MPPQSSHSRDGSRNSVRMSKWLIMEIRLEMVSKRVVLRQPTGDLDWGGDARPYLQNPPRPAAGMDSGIGAIATAVGDDRDGEVVERCFEQLWDGQCRRALSVVGLARELHA